MRSLWRNILLVPLACALLGTGCTENDQSDPPRPVRSVTVHPAPETADMAFSGEIAAHTSIGVSFRIAGKIQERFVGAGDRVQTNTVLARLDDTVLRDSLRSAKANRLAAEAVLEQAEKRAVRAANLIRERAVSRNEYDQTVRQKKEAQEQLASSRSTEHSAAEQLGYAQLLSPARGIVTQRLAECGENVAAGQTVFRIAVDGGVDAVFDMPESAVLAGLSPGCVMHVCLDSRNDVCSDADIYEVSPAADSTTRTYLTKAVIRTPQLQMLLGAAVQGALRLSDAPILSLPAQALTADGNQPAVWVIDKDSHTVSLRRITVVRYTTAEIVVSSGLEAGDEVVTAGVQTLRSGQQVRPSPQSEIDTIKNSAKRK